MSTSLAYSGMFTSISYESVLDTNTRKDTIHNEIKQFEKDHSVYGLAKTDPIRMLDTCKRYNLYLFDDNENYLNRDIVDTYNIFTSNIEYIDMKVKDILKDHLIKNKEDILENIDNQWVINMLNKTPITLDVIGLFYQLGWLTIGEYEKDCLNLYFGGLDKSIVVIPLIREGCTFASCSDIEILSEITTFRNLDIRPDLSLITSVGKIKSFLGDKNVGFTIWLTHSYEISKVQEERYRSFVDRYGYYNKLVTNALLTYYKMNYLKILKESSKIKAKSSETGPYNINNIDRDGIYELCSLKKLNIDFNGSMNVDIKTAWGEEVAIQLYDHDVKLTNPFALPMCGSKFGYLREE